MTYFLIGKNINIVLSPQVASVHGQYISNYLKSRKSAFVNTGARNNVIKDVINS